MEYDDMVYLAFTAVVLLLLGVMAFVALNQPTEYRIVWDDAGHTCGIVSEAHLLSGYTDLGQYCQPGAG